MELRRISFKVAKAIKKAGYPQEDLSVWYDSNGVIFTIHPKEGTEYYVAPEYLSVWLWLWREKKLEIELLHDGGGLMSQIRMQGYPYFFNSDPEEAIIGAIEYLVEKINF